MPPFSDDIRKHISWMKILEFRLIFHWNLFLEIKWIVSQHWFRQWLGAEQATRHYLNQWWTSLSTHINVPRPQWYKPVFNYVRCKPHIQISSLRSDENNLNNSSREWLVYLYVRSYITSSEIYYPPEANSTSMCNKGVIFISADMQIICKLHFHGLHAVIVLCSRTSCSVIPKR